MAMTAQLKCVDVGNFEIKDWWQGDSQPSAIRSILAEVSSGTKKQRYKANSPLVTYKEPSTGCERTVHFGTKAYNYLNHNPIVNDDKTSLDILLPAIFATVGDYKGITGLRTRVRASVPDPARVKEAINSARHHLLATHTYTHNEQTIKNTISEFDVFPEGAGTYWYGRSKGLVPKQGYTCVVDIGGGTWNVLIFDAEGDMVFSFAQERAGGVALANAIASDERLIKALGTTPKLDIVMDGLANDHVYDQTGISWKDWLKDHLDPWFRYGMLTVQAKSENYLSKVRKYLFTGGNTHLISPYIEGKPMAAIVPYARFANVLGLAEIPKGWIA